MCKNSTPYMISIYDETPNCLYAIRRVTVEAFTNSEFGHDCDSELIMIFFWKTINYLQGKLINQGEY